MMMMMSRFLVEEKRVTANRVWIKRVYGYLWVAGYYLPNQLLFFFKFLFSKKAKGFMINRGVGLDKTEKFLFILLF